MKVKSSAYIKENKPIFRKLLDSLLEKYEYASILAADDMQKNARISRQGSSLSEGNTFGKRGYVVRVYDGKAYVEYASNEISEEMIPCILEKIEKDLLVMSQSCERYITPVIEEEEISFDKSTEYEIHPNDMGDEKILDKLADIREYTKSLDERILDVSVNIQFQEYNKMFLSKKKDMEQNVLYTCASLAVIVKRGEEIKDAYKGFSGLCGLEVLDQIKPMAPALVKTAIELLDSVPMVPGYYDCICSPEVTGMIVHEAFGHGAEMDMFVKDRALAKNCMGDMIASEIVTMRDGAASANHVATYFFDDEGVLAHDTLVIDKGKLVSGYSDAVSAARLGTQPTGNGRRESVERKAYTRMTNTFFEPGHDKLEDMIASIEYGMLLEIPSSGMEDPKNWGIQCMVSMAREIKDGKLTGKIFAPVVLTGFVPDLLKSITMMSEDLELGGTGGCGKGWKEWCKVSDGGPWMKAKIRLG